MSFYKMGLAMTGPTPLPARVRDFVDGVTEFGQGSRHFYDKEMVGTEMIGAASGTWVGSLADGLVAIMMDIVHVILMGGGIVMLLRIFS